MNTSIYESRTQNLCFKNADYIQVMLTRRICVYESLVQIKTYYKKSRLSHDVKHFCKNIHNVEWIEVVWSESWLTNNVAPLDDRADSAPVTLVQVNFLNLSRGDTGHVVRPASPNLMKLISRSQDQNFSLKLTYQTHVSLIPTFQ